MIPTQPSPQTGDHFSDPLPCWCACGALTELPEPCAYCLDGRHYRETSGPITKTGAQP
jgi:hypothetical protein